MTWDRILAGFLHSLMWQGGVKCPPRLALRLRRFNEGWPEYTIRNWER